MCTYNAVRVSTIFQNRSIIAKNKQQTTKERSAAVRSLPLIQLQKRIAQRVAWQFRTSTRHTTCHCVSKIYEFTNYDTSVGLLVYYMHSGSQLSLLYVWYHSIDKTKTFPPLLTLRPATGQKMCIDWKDKKLYGGIHKHDWQHKGIQRTFLKTS